ncbi:MAG: GNAT family N-acetyltransferase [Armatimonadetes bacterium]|nr:GNAT family N-acetyltransferase [Armatimonadota bacterium]
MSETATTVEIRNAIGITVDQLAADITRCFEDYVIPANTTPELFSSKLRMDAIDMVNTLLAYQGDEMVGILMICRRDAVARVGAMAIAKPLRRQGVGKILMQRAVEDAKGRGDKQLVLEAISSNAPAIAFYEGFGFRTVFSLLGFRKKLGTEASQTRIRPVGLDEVVAIVSKRPRGTQSWETASATVGNMANPATAYAVDDLAVVVQPIGEEFLLCRGLARSGNDDEAKLNEMITGLAGIYPGRTLRLPPFFPEGEYRELALACGLEIDPLSQVQMELELR